MFSSFTLRAVRKYSQLRERGGLKVSDWQTPDIDRGQQLLEEFPQIYSASASILLFLQSYWRFSSSERWISATLHAYTSEGHVRSAYVDISKLNGTVSIVIWSLSCIYSCGSQGSCQNVHGSFGFKYVHNMPKALNFSLVIGAKYAALPAPGVDRGRQRSAKSGGWPTGTFTFQKKAFSRIETDTVQMKPIVHLADLLVATLLLYPRQKIQPTERVKIALQIAVASQFRSQQIELFLAKTLQLLNWMILKTSCLV